LGEKKVEEKSIDKLIEDELVELRDKSKVIWWDFHSVYYSILSLLKISLTQILCFLYFSVLAQTFMWLSNINSFSHNFLQYSIFKIIDIFIQWIPRFLVMPLLIPWFLSFQWCCHIYVFSSLSPYFLSLLSLILLYYPWDEKYCMILEILELKIILEHHLYLLSCWHLSKGYFKG
jgi:hypothetical protein